MKEYYDAYLWGLIIGWLSMCILALMVWAFKTKKIQELTQQLNDLNKHFVVGRSEQLNLCKCGKQLAAECDDCFEARIIDELES